MRRILLLVVALILATPATAVAQDDRARSVQLIAQGNQASDTGDFRGALEAYRDAYEVSRDPAILYRIGLTYENLSNYQLAREHLELYLRAEPDAPYAARVKSKIENLRGHEASLQAAVRVETTPPGARVWIDTDTGRPAGVTPVRIPVGPGAHTVLIRKSGFDDVRDSFDAQKSETVLKSYTLHGEEPVAETPTPPEAQEPEAVAETVVIDPATIGRHTPVRVGPSLGLAVLGWVSIGAGWALIVTSGVTSQVFGVSKTVVGATFFGGVGIAATGAYLLWFRDYSPELPPAAARVLQATPPQRIVGIGLQF